MKAFNHKLSACVSKVTVTKGNVKTEPASTIIWMCKWAVVVAK